MRACVVTLALGLAVAVRGSGIAREAGFATVPVLASVVGHVSVATPGVDLASVGPVVVFLDGLDGPLAFNPPPEIPEISQKGARFSPPFLVVSAGQAVRIPNDDGILHNAFSYSRPNAFDLGLYPKGDARTITIREPGAVQIYCSIHKSMNAVIYAAPSPYFAIADAHGAFVIRDVPAGAYRVGTWAERLPSTEGRVEVRAGGASTIDLSIGGDTP